MTCIKPGNEKDVKASAAKCIPRNATSHDVIDEKMAELG